MLLRNPRYLHASTLATPPLRPRFFCQIPPTPRKNSIPGYATDSSTHDLCAIVISTDDVALANNISSHWYDSYFDKSIKERIVEMYDLIASVGMPCSHTFMTCIWIRDVMVISPFRRLKTFEWDIVNYMHEKA